MSSSNKIEEKRRNIPPNDKLEIWSTSSTINFQKSEGKRNVSTVIELYSRLPPLADIEWGPRPGYEYFNGGSFKIQRDFLAPDFYLNCIFPFLCFFLLFNKRILLLILLTQIQSPFFCCESIVFVEDLVFKRES